MFSVGSPNSLSRSGLPVTHGNSAAPGASFKISFSERLKNIGDSHLDMLKHFSLGNVDPGTVSARVVAAASQFARTGSALPSLSGPPGSIQRHVAAARYLGLMNQDVEQDSDEPPQITLKALEAARDSTLAKADRLPETAAAVLRDEVAAAFEGLRSLAIG
jgi:hypothetical protein